MAVWQRRVVCVGGVLAMALLLAEQAGMAQQPSGGEQAVAADAKPDASLPEAIYLVGLGDVKEQTKGALHLQPRELEFTSKEVRAAIPVDHMLAISVGDERTERGGTAGKIARKVIPYGGGAALGAASQKSVDVLTVEYRDAHDGYHAAVFVLPTKQAEAMRADVAAQLKPVETRPPLACSAPQPGTAILEPIGVEGVELPAEYRALLYEHLLTQLKKERPADTFLRAGDIGAGPGCSALALRVSVHGFKKGNQALRASTGPLGFFLGTTAIEFKMHLEDAAGKSLFDAELKKKNRSDSDSLNVAKDLAKSVAKKMDKALKKSEKAGIKAVAS